MRKTKKQEGGDYYPIFASRESIAEHHISILLYHQTVQRPDGRGGVVERIEAHYAYIADISKLLRKTYRREGSGIKDYEKCHICPNCLCRFSSEGVRNRHFSICKVNEAQRIKVPSEGDTLSFKHHVRKFRLPLVGYFDFEALQKRPEKRCVGSCVDPENCIHQTFCETEQRAGTYSLVIVNWENEIVHQHTFSSESAGEDFVDHLLEIEDELMEILAAKEPMNLTLAEEVAFRRARICHICGEMMGINPKTGRRDAVRGKSVWQRVPPRIAERIDNVVEHPQRDPLHEQTIVTPLAAKDILEFFGNV